MPHRRSIAALALAAALGALACDGAPTPPDASALLDEREERVPITRLRAEPYSLTFSSGLYEPSRSVVRDDVLWGATWTAIWARHEPMPPLPAVDFTREMVVVAALGARSGGGHGIVLDSATTLGGTLVVHLRTTSPNPPCAVTGAFTSPVDVARLPRHDGPVEFREHVQAQRCD